MWLLLLVIILLTGLSLYTITSRPLIPGYRFRTRGPDGIDRYLDTCADCMDGVSGRATVFSSTRDVYQVTALSNNEVTLQRRFSDGSLEAGQLEVVDRNGVLTLEDRGNATGTLLRLVRGTEGYHLVYQNLPLGYQKCTTTNCLHPHGHLYYPVFGALPVAEFRTEMAFS